MPQWRIVSDDLDTRIARLVEAVETAGDVTPLVDKLRTLQARPTALDREIAGRRPIARPAPAVIEDRLAEWRRLLRGSVAQARTVIQKIVVCRIRFTPHKSVLDGETIDGYAFELQTRFDKLFSGVAAVPPPETEDPSAYPHFGSEETLDGDFGGLLEKAYTAMDAEVVASSRATSEVFRRRGRFSTAA